MQRSLPALLSQVVAALWLVSVAVQAAPISTTQLMAPNSLPDMTLGKATAPVIIVEYSSMTCPHCADFERAVIATIKTQYIDTGNVYFVFREFPLDQLAFAAAIAARCAPREEFFPIIETLFRNQDIWAFVDDPATALIAQLQPYGFTRDSFAACLRNDEIAKGINDIADSAFKDFSVDGTPTLFINGEKYVGEIDIGQIEAILDSLIANAKK